MKSLVTKEKIMPVEVNTAALKVVLKAAARHLQTLEALGLDTRVWVLGDDEPTELETCVRMLRNSLEKENANDLCLSQRTRVEPAE